MHKHKFIYPDVMLSITNSTNEVVIFHQSETEAEALKMAYDFQEYVKASIEYKPNLSAYILKNNNITIHFNYKKGEQQ